jgi:hypothetical protein
VQDCWEYWNCLRVARRQVSFDHDQTITSLHRRAGLDTEVVVPARGQPRRGIPRETVEKVRGAPRQGRERTWTACCDSVDRWLGAPGPRAVDCVGEKVLLVCRVGVFGGSLAVRRVGSGWVVPKETSPLRWRVRVDA